MNKFLFIIILLSFKSIVSQEGNKELPPFESKSIDSTTTKANELSNLPEIEKGVSVIFEDKSLFRIYSPLGPFSAQERAKAIAVRLENIKKLKTFKESDLQIIKSEFTTDIVFNSEIIMSITSKDSIEAEKDVKEMANDYYAIIKDTLKVIPNYTIVNNPNDLYELFIANKEIVINAGISGALFILLLLVIFINGKMFESMILRFKNGSGQKLNPIHFKGNEILSRASITTTVSLFLKGTKLIVAILLIYAYINLLFHLFPWSKYSNVKTIIWGLMLTLLSILIWYGLYKSMKVFFELLNNSISKKEVNFIKPLVINKITLLSENQIKFFINRISLFFQFIINLFLVYIFIPIVFSYFDFSKDWADTLFGYILDPLRKIIMSFVHFFPNLMFILVIIVVNRYISKISKFFFNEIQIENIKISGFRSEWADPTYKIIRFLIIVFTIIMVYPYLPGSDSEAFKGVSVLLGILISFGSTSIIGNAVSGIILTYMYAFQEGDRVKIGDTLGDVIEKTLLVTRIKTVKNVIVSIPNSIVMNTHIVNYSSSLNKENLILHTSITLGYDVPWKKVHSTLIEAAHRTENVLKDPAPFVFQTSLDDYYVAYELNVYTDKPHIMSKIYSELHQNMQDTCNENGIEILSPRFNAVRDGNQSTIPENYLPKSYESPSFKVRSEKKD